MTVYVLHKNFKTVVGIFSTEEKAYEAWSVCKDDKENWYYVREYIVDEYQKPEIKKES